MTEVRTMRTATEAVCCTDVTRVAQSGLDRWRRSLSSFQRPAFRADRAPLHCSVMDGRLHRWTSRRRPTITVPAVRRVFYQARNRPALSCNIYNYCKREIYLHTFGCPSR